MHRTAIWFTLVLLAAAPAHAEDDWYPSRYGADDTLGAANLLKPEHVLQAVQLVREGKTYALGQPTGPDTPAFGTRKYEILTVPGSDGSGASLGTNKTTFNDDLLMTWLGIGTQLDGLGHLGIDHRYYNGTPVADFLRPNGLIKFSTHLVPPIVTRGVLLDIAALKGVEMLAGGTPVGRADLEAAAARQGVTLREGDVVLLHTGYAAMADRDREAYLTTIPGLVPSGAEYLAGLGVVAVGADTWAMEAVPAEDPEQQYPVHQILLAKHGVYILENIQTQALAADGASEFLFVLGQPRFVGAVQTVINPIAIR